jgi:molybdenum cofactor cytidylyltransferase
MDRSVAAVVLAAGAATRMGRLKQLLPYRGRTLVEHTVAQAKAAQFSPIIVVIGAEAQAVAASLAHADVTIVENPQWSTGMGSSIVAGISHLQTLPVEPEAAAMLLADQPRIGARHLQEMLRVFSGSNGLILAARYNGALGVPALFRYSMFPKLRSLDPAAGARAILRDPQASVTAFDLPEAAIDIDTPAEFAALE